MAIAACPVPAHAATFTISWDAPAESPDVTAYRVYRATSSTGLYTYLKRVTAASTGVTVATNETGCYRVTAVDSLGQASQMSGFVCITVTAEVGD